MSLDDAYRLAHSAQCRLSMEASRPERNLRFVVGHLMHYESLRLRIAEIEHDLAKHQTAKAVAFTRVGPTDHRLQHKNSTGQLRSRSPPPPPAYDEDEDDEDDDIDPSQYFTDAEEDEAGLSLERFPSSTARSQHPPPDLEPDDAEDDDYDDDDECVSPDEPDQEVLARTVRGDEYLFFASMYEGVRKCPCHGKTEAPHVERMWELPSSEQEKPDVTITVAQVKVEAI